MKRSARFLVILLLALGTGSALAQGGPPPQAKGEFKTTTGESVGNVTMTQTLDGMVMISASVRGLPPGEHGVHIHAVGDCTPPFEAAGPHYNPMAKQHGLDNPDGPHAGDLPNLMVKADGTGEFSAKTTMVTITSGPMTLFDADGSALVIHALVDDQKTDPSGNSDGRIACAVLQPVVAQSLAQLPAQSGGHADFKNAAGASVGSATLTPNADGSVRLLVQVHGMSAGQHGIHFHQFGACAPTFGAAGEHYNPMGTMHGLENPAGPHAGDLPNLIINADGTGALDTNTKLVTLATGPMTLFDTDGSALVIHALVDDEKTDPSGNSDGRIACAVIQPDIQAAQTSPTGTNTPAQLPNTGGADISWLALVIAALLVFGAGTLAVRRARS